MINMLPFHNNAVRTNETRNAFRKSVSLLGAPKSRNGEMNEIIVITENLTINSRVRPFGFIILESYLKIPAVSFVKNVTCIASSGKNQVG